MARLLPAVHLTCTSCGRGATLTAAAAAAHLDGAALSYETVARLARKLRCTGCGSRQARLSGPDGTVLIDPERQVPCRACGDPIILPRLQAAPGTRVCKPCADEGEHPSAVAPWPLPPSEHGRCPRCGRATLVNYSPKNHSVFFGCSGYPGACSWTRPMAADTERLLFGAEGVAGYLRAARAGRPLPP